MGIKTILIILIMVGSLTFFNQPVIAENTAYSLSTENSLSLVVEEFGGTYYVLIEINSVGSYNLSIHAPRTLTRLEYEVINDIDIYTVDSFYSMGIPIVQKNLHINLEYDDEEIYGYSIFNVLKVPDKNSMGLVIRYSIDDSFQDTSSKILVNLDNNELKEQNSVTLQFSDSQNTEANLILPSVSSTGMYTIGVSATGELANAKIYFTSYPSQREYRFYIDSEDTLSFQMYLTTETQVIVQIIGYVSINNPNIKYDFTLSKNDAPIITTKSYDFTDDMILQIPTLFSPKSMQIEYSGDSIAYIDIISVMQSQEITNLEDGQKVDTIIFETGTGYSGNIGYSYLYNLNRIENSIWPLYNGAEYSFKNIGLIKKTFNINDNYYRLDQKLNYISQISGSPTFLQIRGGGEMHINITMTDYTPIQLSNFGLKTLQIMKNNPLDFYEIEVSENSQKIIVNGEFEATAIGFSGEISSFHSGRLFLFEPEGIAHLNYYDDNFGGANHGSEYPVINPGKYYVVFDGYLEQWGHNFQEIDTSTIGISLNLNISHTVGEPIFERSTETFILGSGKYTPSSQLRVFNVEKDTAYQVFADMGPFTTYSYYSYTSSSIYFVNPEGNNPFREVSPLYVSGGISSHSQVFTAKESSRVYMIISGRGYINVTIVKVGSVKITEIYHVSEIEESNFPDLVYIALFSLIYLVRKKRKRSI